MSGLIGLNLNTRQLERALRTLGTKAPIAIARALNRSGVTTRTVMVRTVSKHLGKKASDVGRLIKVENATPERLSVRVRATGRQIPLIAFNARGPEPSRGKGRGVSVKLPHGRVIYPRAFIARMRSGKRGVFERVGKARLPIKQKFGPSIPGVFDAHRREGREAGRVSLVKNLSHELRWAIRQSATGS